MLGVKNQKTLSRRAKLTSDTGVLLLVQGLGYLIPLATLPFLVRTLGPSAFGTYGLAMAFVGYLQILLEYGFWLSGTKNGVAALHDPAALSRLYWSIYGTKIILLMFAIPPLTICIGFIPSLRNCVEYILIISLGVIGASLFPLWLLQARGLLKDFAWILSILKISNLSVFIFIRGPEDIRSLAWIFAIQSICHGIIGQFAALRGIRISRPPPTWIKDSIHQLKSDFSIFISQLGGTLIANSTSFVLGTTAGPEALGIYMVADKIIRAGASLTIPVSQAVMPMSASLFHSDTPRNAFRFLKKFAIIAGGGILFGCIFVGTFSSFIVHLISGTENQTIILCLRILAIYPLIVFLNNLLGPQILLQLNQNKSILKSNLIACAFGLIMHPILIPIFRESGTAAVVLLAEASSTPFLLKYVFGHLRLLKNSGDFDRVKVDLPAA